MNYVLIEWLTIKNQKQAVRDDVDRIHNHPFVPKSIPVYGYITTCAPASSSR